MKRLLIVTLMFMASAGYAFAQTAVADPTAIPLKPLFDFLQPILTAVVTTLAGTIATVLSMKLYSMMHITMTATQEDNIRKRAETQAGAIAAAATAGFSNEVIHVDDPRIVRAANAVIQQAPNDLKALGVTPDAVRDAVAKIVQGEVGKIQQQALPVPVPAASILSMTGPGK